MGSSIGSDVGAGSIHEEAVRHALMAEQAAHFTWTHLEAEYTQDIEKVLATLATAEPLTWTLPELVGDDGAATYLAGTDYQQIHDQYHSLREFVEIHDWRALVEIRQSWYVMTHGVVTLKLKATGEYTRSQTVTMFPTGRDGILGEVQIGAVNRRVPPDSTDPDFWVAKDRLAALAAHDAYVGALRSGDVDAIVAANRPNGAAAIRNYLTDESTVLNVDSAAELGEYFRAFYDRYAVRDIQLVNRVAESWYVFAELHWIVEEQFGERRTLHFCTAETSPLDDEGRYWVRTGSGTDPVVV
jgi:hypothetical protein